MLHETGTEVKVVPDGYDYVLEPCNIGELKSLEGGIQGRYTFSKTEQYSAQ